VTHTVAGSLPAPVSRNALALLRFPDRRTGWVVVAAATLAAPVEDLGGRLAELHRAVPLVGARLRGEVWHAGAVPAPLAVDGEPLAAPGLVGRFDLAAEAPLRVLVGAGGRRLAVACHHAAFDGLGLVALLAALAGGPLPAPAPDWRGGGRPAPELRGLLGRLARPADRVAPSPAGPSGEALAVREARLAGPAVTARLAAAAVAAAGARNARLGARWRRVGVNLGVGGPSQEARAGRPLAGNASRYRRVDLAAGEPVGPAVAAALASPREPPDQVWSPRLGRLLEPLAGRFSDSLLVSNVGRRAVPGARRLDFFPVARGRSAVAFGSAGLPGGPSTVSVRARDLYLEDAEALLAEVVARLEA
jgi:hypothetical protein